MIWLMRRNVPIIVILIVTFSLILAGNQVWRDKQAHFGILELSESQSEKSPSSGGLLNLLKQTIATPSPSATPPPSLPPLPSSYIIPGKLHVFQTFNNCGPASLSMLLSYYDVQISQAELGAKLRPYQVSGGDNDDKSVILSELAREAQTRGFTAYHRPSGNTERVKQFIAHDMPVLMRTWLKPGEDIGHYRLIRGYDDRTSEFIQDDSLQGKDLRYSYDSLLSLWQAFSYEYVVIVPPDKETIARTIMGDDIDENVAWKRAKERIQKELTEDPGNMYGLFNMSVVLFHLGDYKQSVSYFEQVENRLPFRMLWYQIEPIESYFHLKQYDRVLTLTDKILNNQNRAFSELYYLRGLLYKDEGKIEDARYEFENAIRYNVNFEPAKAQLNTLR